MCTLSSRRGGVAALALLAVLLGACGGDDGPDDGGTGGGTVDVPLGTSQLSAADRTTVAARLGAAAAEVGGTDPAGAAVLTAFGDAIVAEGWVTGVTVTSALSLASAGPATRASLASQGVWAVFGGTVGVFTGQNPQTQQATGYIVRGIVAMRDSTIVVGYNTWDLYALEPTGTFGHGGAQGLVFEGSTRTWSATAGIVSLSAEDSIPSQCSGFPRDGITCANASHANGTLAISTSVPVPGTGATGGYTFGFAGQRLRGYVLSVSCEESSVC